MFTKKTVAFNYEFDGTCYNIEIDYKNIRSCSLKVVGKNSILVTSSYLYSKRDIIKYIELNMKKIHLFEKRFYINNEDYYLGKKYNVITTNTKPEIIDDYIYIRDRKELDKWYRKQANTVFQERLDILYNKFDENIPYPKLKIQKMETRWGVCNRRDNSVKLNYYLIHHNIDEIDYVIVHELSHFVEFNHSRKFWQVVEKYCPEYKKITKEMG